MSIHASHHPNTCIPLSPGPAPYLLNGQDIFESALPRGMMDQPYPQASWTIPTCLIAICVISSLTPSKASWIIGHSRFATASKRRSNLRCMGGNKAWHCGS
eukprot:1153084-Pelagomonas_calceolata.AAC.4